ncbi:MAG TPA: 3-methyl-2-oxobutanoate hydroxymethyltransferase [Candidatus Omnitrophota bacterium]|nr:3-methyl-2-oxobutanoate hydroxymethyltransferase [Candidatus Omnitrophota bacterium]
MKLTPKNIYEKKQAGSKITVLSLYDYPSARIADEAGVDILMIGDSVAMVLLGHENTLGVTMEHMLYHTVAVSQAVRKGLVVADMPAHSYDDPEIALKNAKRFLEEGHADAVKLEGGSKVLNQVQKLIALGIPVMGHLGMLPQTSGSQFHVQGKTPEEAKVILEDAKMLDRLGVFAIVLECIPAKLAAEITQAVKCPTIGIGAGPETDGQVLVLQDILGIRSNVSPRFVRRYADLETIIKKAVQSYCQDVIKGQFPSKKESF